MLPGLSRCSAFAHRFSQASLALRQSSSYPSAAARRHLGLATVSAFRIDQRQQRFGNPCPGPHPFHGEPHLCPTCQSKGRGCSTTLSMCCPAASRGDGGDPPVFSCPVPRPKKAVGLVGSTSEPLGLKGPSGEGLELKDPIRDNLGEPRPGRLGLGGVPAAAGMPLGALDRGGEALVAA